MEAWAKRRSAEQALLHARIDEAHDFNDELKQIKTQYEAGIITGGEYVLKVEDVCQRFLTVDYADTPIRVVDATGQLTK